MRPLSLVHLTFFALGTNAQANIPVYPITDVNTVDKTGYFSDPYHVPYEDSQDVFISGTTQKYMNCSTALQPKCATFEANTYKSSDSLKSQLSGNTTICSPAGIHPFQSGSGTNRSWDAVVTLHIQDSPACDGISGWSVIVHAHPENSSDIDLPPTSWVGDELLVGSFTNKVDANYDGKYFKTPAGKLYLVYQKQNSSDPKRDGVAAWPMEDPTTKTPNSEPTFLLLPDDDLNSEDYVAGNSSFKLIETGNIRAINGKFVMAYSVGAYNHKTYKAGIAYSDTFLPSGSQTQYRKVMKNNPNDFWNSAGSKEVYYLLQAQEESAWRYVGDQVLAPGVPTVAKIGAGGDWVLTFAGYDPSDAPVQDGTSKYEASHRRPFYIGLNVSVPSDTLVKDASDFELQSWITPAHN